MCNTTIKTISKVPVNRIRPLLGDLISPYQTTFVKGRQAADNVILLQEILHNMTRKKGKKGQFVVKIDLLKAYDPLESSFVRKCLQHFNLPQNVINIIMACITTTSFSTIVNGCKSKSFSASRGIRQGDPLSPFLFILCLEYLSFLISKECLKQSWKPVSVSRGGQTISYCFFADDILLYGILDDSTPQVILRIFQHFSEVSGLQVNPLKSVIHFSNNCKQENRMSICQLLNFTEGDSLGKYLGFPISAKKTQKGGLQIYN